MVKTTRNHSDSFQQGPDLFAQSWGVPDVVRDWFLARDWTPRPHQLDMLEADRAGKSALLIAPTGAGKTLSGFLPSICDLAETPHEGLHTLYISPLKALAVDVARNLVNPIEEMGLNARVETRTGDTPSSRRQRQRFDPPHILMTTPGTIGADALASRSAQIVWHPKTRCAGRVARLGPLQTR